MDIASFGRFVERVSVLNIVCVNSQNYLGMGADYVNRLYAMVARNLSVGTEGRFVCFTDDDSGIRQEIHCRPLPHGINGWWNKLALFAPGEFDYHDRVLYFDLDTVIVGDLDEIARYDGLFIMLRDFYREYGRQSSVMAWKSGFGAEIWQRWNREGRPEIEGGDQAWIEQVIPDFGSDIWQEFCPGKFVSFKKDCIPYPPEGASVVCFHGEPRPHDCGRTWVEAMWTESDTGHFSLAMIPNIPLDQLRRQARHSAKLILPRLKSQPPHDRKVAIIGGGPSIGDPVIQAELSLLRSCGTAIWALNGSYDWLLDRGLVADAHVLLDARAENMRFLRHSRSTTTYYLASICSPLVYDELIRNERKIIRFDLDVMGDCGTTVGTHAIAVAFTEGYREIHLYGYDSSYRVHVNTHPLDPPDGHHERYLGHAYEQSFNDEDRIVDAHVGDRVFKAAPWMVRQSQDFQGLAEAIMAAGGTIVVHGDGLLPYVAQQMCAVPTHKVRAWEVLKRLPEGAVQGAEIGVFCGAMSAALLEREDLSLLMIDSWEANGAAYQASVGDWHTTQGQADQDRACKIALQAVEFAGKRATVCRARSLEAVSGNHDGTFDFVFIDADHSYEGCSADIAAWTPKIKPGGLLCGHDYDNPDFPDFGVKRAVDEYAESAGRTVELGENLTWFIRL